MEITIADPLRLYHPPYSLELLREKFFNPNKSFWELAGEKPTHIFCTSDNISSELVFRSAKGVGVSVEYANSAPTETDSIFLTSEIDDRRTVEVFGENSFIKYYRKNFLPESVAWQAIEYFAETGDMNPNLNWQALEMPEQDLMQFPIIDESRKFVFADPMNNEHEYFDWRWLKALVLERGDDYWVGANGESLIYLTEFDKATTHLHLFCNEKYGFVVEYNEQTKKTVNAVNDQATNEIVEVDCYADTSPYYRKYLIAKETTWEIIEHFFNRGEKYPHLNWEIADIPETD